MRTVLAGVVAALLAGSSALAQSQLLFLAEDVPAGLDYDGPSVGANTSQTGFINPELMGFHMSAHAIMMVILGGMGNFAGAIVGAFAFETLLHAFQDLPAIGAFDTGKHWQLWMGLFIVLVVVFAPRGLLGVLERVLRRKERHDE